MEYRRLGKAGLQLSELSLGAWVTYGGQVGQEVAEECMAVAYEAGVNFFDNAESYAGGNAEIVMGNVIKKLGWRREDLVVLTKVFWGGHGRGPNDRGLSHKHLIEGFHNSLRRLQMDYVDLIFCHRPDPNTPIEETVRAMDILIKQGKAFYWGTSEWSAADIMRADGIARQYGLTPPSMEQPQYNQQYVDCTEEMQRQRGGAGGRSFRGAAKAAILFGQAVPVFVGFFDGHVAGVAHRDQLERAMVGGPARQFDVY